MSQLEMGSQRSRQAGPSSGLKPPAAAAQGPGVPLETLAHFPEALPEVSVVAPSPVDAELRAGHMAAALQVGSLVLPYKSDLLPGNFRWLVTISRLPNVVACIRNEHRQSRLCRCRLLHWRWMG